MASSSLPLSSIHPEVDRANGQGQTETWSVLGRPIIGYPLKPVAFKHSLNTRRKQRSGRRAEEVSPALPPIHKAKVLQRPPCCPLLPSSISPRSTFCGLAKHCSISRALLESTSSFHRYLRSAHWRLETRQVSRIVSGPLEKPCLCDKHITDRSQCSARLPYFSLINTL